MSPSHPSCPHPPPPSTLPLTSLDILLPVNPQTVYQPITHTAPLQPPYSYLPQPFYPLSNSYPSSLQHPISSSALPQLQHYSFSPSSNQQSLSPTLSHSQPIDTTPQSIRQLSISDQTPSTTLPSHAWPVSYSLPIYTDSNNQHYSPSTLHPSSISTAPLPYARVSKPASKHKPATPVTSSAHPNQARARPRLPSQLPSISAPLDPTLSPRFSNQLQSSPIHNLPSNHAQSQNHNTLETEILRDSLDDIALHTTMYPYSNDVVLSPQLSTHQHHQFSPPTTTPGNSNYTNIPPPIAHNDYHQPNLPSAQHSTILDLGHNINTLDPPPIKPPKPIARPRKVSNRSPKRRNKPRTRPKNVTSVPRATIPPNPTVQSLGYSTTNDAVPAQLVTQARTPPTSHSANALPLKPSITHRVLTHEELNTAQSVSAVDHVISPIGQESGLPGTLEARKELQGTDKHTREPNGHSQGAQGNGYVCAPSMAKSNPMANTFPVKPTVLSSNDCVVLSDSLVTKSARKTNVGVSPVASELNADTASIGPQISCNQAPLHSIQSIPPSQSTLLIADRNQSRGVRASGNSIFPPSKGVLKRKRSMTKKAQPRSRSNTNVAQKSSRKERTSKPPSALVKMDKRKRVTSITATASPERKMTKTSDKHVDIVQKVANKLTDGSARVCSFQTPTDSPKGTNSNDEIARREIEDNRSTKVVTKVAQLSVHPSVPAPTPNIAEDDGVAQVQKEIRPAVPNISGMAKGRENNGNQGVCTAEKSFVARKVPCRLRLGAPHKIKSGKSVPSISDQDKPATNKDNREAILSKSLRPTKPKQKRKGKQDAGSPFRKDKTKFCESERKSLPEPNRSVHPKVGEDHQPQTSKTGAMENPSGKAEGLKQPKVFLRLRVRPEQAPVLCRLSLKQNVRKRPRSLRRRLNDDRHEQKRRSRFQQSEPLRSSRRRNARNMESSKTCSSTLPHDRITDPQHPRTHPSPIRFPSNVSSKALRTSSDSSRVGQTDRILPYNAEKLLNTCDIRVPDAKLVRMEDLPEGQAKRFKEGEMKCLLCCDSIDIESCTPHPMFPMRSMLICLKCYDFVYRQSHVGREMVHLERSSLMVSMVEEMVKSLPGYRRRQLGLENAWKGLAKQSISDFKRRLSSHTVPYEFMVVIRALFQQVGVKFADGGIQFPSHVIELLPSDGLLNIIENVFPKSFEDVELGNTTKGQALWKEVFGECFNEENSAPSCEVLQKVFNLIDIRCHHIGKCEWGPDAPQRDCSCKIQFNHEDIAASLNRASKSSSVLKLLFAPSWKSNSRAEYKGEEDIVGTNEMMFAKANESCCFCTQSHHAAEYPFEFVQCTSCSRRFCSVCYLNSISMMMFSSFVRNKDSFKCLMCHEKDYKERMMSWSTMSLGERMAIRSSSKVKKRNVRSKNSSLSLLRLSNEVRQHIQRNSPGNMKEKWRTFAKMCELSNVKQLTCSSQREARETPDHFCLKCSLPAQNLGQSEVEGNSRARRMSETDNLVRCNERGCSVVLHRHCYNGGKQTRTRGSFSGGTCPRHKCSKCPMRGANKLVNCRTCVATYCVRHLPPLSEIHVYSDRLISCPSCTKMLAEPSYNLNTIGQLYQRDANILRINPLAARLSIIHRKLEAGIGLRLKRKRKEDAEWLSRSKATEDSDRGGGEEDSATRPLKRQRRE